MRGSVRTLASLLVAGCWLSSVQCFTGLASHRAVRRATLPTRSNAAFSSRVSRRACDDGAKRRGCGGVMMVSKPSAAEAKGETVDPAEVEAALVEEDKNVYLGLFALQLLPSLLIGYKLASFVYFGLLAVSTVYLGSKRMDIPDETRNPITAAQAFGAPFAASVSLFGVFALLKYTDISVGIAYQA
ncbi:unnamed protein product, partial [Ectocarpus sp. 8 AP-2014]